MKKIKLIWTLLAVMAFSGIAVPVVQADDEEECDFELPFTTEFFQDECKLRPRGKNDYFLRLKPGCWLLLEGEEEGDDEELVTLTVLIEVLPGKKVVDGVKCAIVRETEWEDDELVEISWNYFAICKHCKDVFYFGERVNDYEDGEIVGHGGEWLAGVDGAQAGVIMPGCPLIGSRYYQEVAPGIAEDRAEHLDNETTIETDYGTFENCLYTVETTPLDPEEESFKAYARGVGLILDDVITLVDYGCGGYDDDDSSDDDSSDDDD